LIDYGIAVPQPSPFIYYDPQSEHDIIQGPNVGPTETEFNQQEIEEDNILNHTFTIESLDRQFSSDIPQLTQAPSPLRTGLSSLSEDQLDHHILQLRAHYTRAGITMLDGMLRRLGYHISREAICQSLLQIDPVQRVFERIRIRR